MLQHTSIEELLVKYEPKVQSMLRVIRPSDKDDLAQELRYVIVRCATLWRPDGGATFNTYVHGAMLKKRATFLTKNYLKQVETVELEPYHDSVVTTHLYEPFLLDHARLTDEEQEAVSLLSLGYTVSEVGRMGIEASTITSLKKKIIREHLM